MSSQIKYLTKSINIKKKIPLLISYVIAVILLLLLAVAPQYSISGAKKGLLLCAEILIPSFFPFLAIAGFLIESGLPRVIGKIFDPLTQLLFKLPGSTASAFVVGILSGYPVGAKFVSGLYKKGMLTKSEAERSLCFCVNSGAAFIIGSVGAGILHNISAGILIFIAHILASLLIAFGTRFMPKKTHSNDKQIFTNQNKTISQKFVNGVIDAGYSMINICAFVILFSSITSILSGFQIIPTLSQMLGNVFGPIGLTQNVFQSLLTGILEVTNGCAIAGVIPNMQTVIIISAILGWSGFCVHCQVVSAISDTDLSAKPYFVARFAHAILSIGIVILLFNLFPQYIPTFAGEQTATPQFAISSAPASIALLLLISILMFSDIKTASLDK
jgi:sporulation integral membrane protein YlbJ